jgi:hypothetical protein
MLEHELAATVAGKESCDDHLALFRSHPVLWLVQAPGFKVDFPGARARPMTPENGASGICVAPLAKRLLVVGSGLGARRWFRAWGWLESHPD